MLSTGGRAKDCFERRLATIPEDFSCNKFSLCLGSVLAQRKAFKCYLKSINALRFDLQSEHHAT